MRTATADDNTPCKRESLEHDGGADLEDGRAKIEGGCVQLMRAICVVRRNSLLSCAERKMS